MSQKLLVTVLIACVAVALLTGCARIEEIATPEPTVVTQEATRAVAGASVVGKPLDGLPEGLPLWPDAEVMESSDVEGTYWLLLRTTDAFADVLSGVAVGFEDAEWTVASEEAGEEGGRTAILSVVKDGQDGVVTITETEDGHVEIDYVIAPGA